MGRKIHYICYKVIKMEKLFGQRKANSSVSWTNNDNINNNKKLRR